ncbi:hypothetical protein A9W99_07575 [Mycobacterium sp. 1164966.3]|nr:hypothetical protein A9W99_07575 [Mycobacterium sp. 1164966.3]
MYRAARITAAELGTSVSALVAGYLGTLSERDAEFSRLEEKQRKTQAEIRRFRAGNRLSRDEVHDRAVH